MAKMTKAQQKRMVRDINNKVKKLFVFNMGAYTPGYSYTIIDSKDMAAMEKLCSKWLKRIG